MVIQSWCACGSLDKLVDANGNLTQWDHDVQGRVIKETRANGSFKSTVYEATTSRVAETIDAKLQEIHYAYALDGKLLSTSYVNAEHPTPNVSLSYTDPATGAPDAHGRLRQTSDGTGTTVYSYHPFSGLGAGQLASVDGPLTNDTVSYVYDELGRTASRTLNGVTSTWHYDLEGRLQSQIDPIGTFNYTYDGVTGRVLTVSYPNGQTSTYSYFPTAQEHRLQEILHQKPGGATLNKFDYTYDAVGNIKTWTQQTDSDPAKVYNLEYDLTDQLTAATLTTGAPPTTLKRYRYAYDPAGNRTAEQIDDVVTGATYDNMNRLLSQQPGGAMLFRGSVNEPATVTVANQPATVDTTNQFSGTAPVPSGTPTVQVKATDFSNNTRINTYQLSETGATTSFTYDANGNLTGDGTKTYEWDAANRLLAVKQGGGTLASFTYGGAGRRATKTAGGVTTSYVYDGAQFLEERPGAGTTKRYVYGPGIDRALAQSVGSVTSYFVADHLGSIVQVTDSVGAATLAREYDPWGNLLQGSTTGGYAFTGREWDPEVGRYYYRARYYDPGVGRFISEDPTGLKGGINRYAYVANHPSIATDASGLRLVWKLYGVKKLEIQPGKVESLLKEQMTSNATLSTWFDDLLGEKSNTIDDILYGPLDVEVGIRCDLGFFRGKTNYSPVFPAFKGIPDRSIALNESLFHYGWFSSDLSDEQAAAQVLIHELSHWVEAYSLGRIWPGRPKGFYDTGDYVESLVRW